jgi:hypothetical protein
MKLETLGAVALLALAGAANAGSFVAVAPDAAAGTTTSLLGINDAGYLVGSLSDDSTSAAVGLIRDPSGNYSTFTDGSQFQTTARAISNANVVSGYSTDATLNLLTDSEFQYNGSTVGYLTNGATPLHGIPQGMNNNGAVVGDYYFNSGGHTYRHGYVISGGVFTDLSYNPAYYDHTQARGITNTGEVVGWVSNGMTGAISGFSEIGGVFTYYNDPNPLAVGTYFEGVNNYGEASGEWLDAAGNTHAFEYNFATGVYLNLNPPGAGASTQAFGINDLGEVIITDGLGGNWLFDVGVPEPSTWTSMILGVAMGGAVLRRRRQRASL